MRDHTSPTDSRPKVWRVFGSMTAGVAVYAFIIAPLLIDDVDYGTAIQYRFIHTFLPYAVLFAIAATVIVGILTLTRKR